MAVSIEIMDELLKDYKGPDDILGPEGLLKRLTKALVEQTIYVEIID
jgi:putative transposase